MLAADGSLFLPSSWPVPNTSSQGARFWNLGAIDAQSVTSDLLPTRTRGHCHGLPHRALGGRPLAAKVHCPLMCPPRKLPPRGLGGTSNICKLRGLSPAPPVSLGPQAGSAPPPPQHVHSAVDVPWAVRVGARGGLGRAAQGALGQPLPVLWRGRFCLCTFASFVMKPNKNPMFSSLPPPLSSCPHSPTQR